LGVLPTFLIGLREGLEASLVVSILVAYLVRTGNRDRLGPIWIGVAAAVACSLTAGIIFTYVYNDLSFEAQEAFGGGMSIVAVGFVTWMVFWMKRQSRHLKSELSGKLAIALEGSALGLAVVAFLAVGREGLETALFVWSAVKATGDGITPLAGAVLGLGASVVLAWLLYRKSVTINMARFFTFTGAALVIVAAGVLAYGVHDLQEANILPGLRSLAFDVSDQIPPSSWYGTLLKGTINFSAETTWLQAIAWFGYVIPVMVLFFRPAKTSTSSSAPTPRATPAPTTTLKVST
jgi:high-affinity iron transporter